MKEGIPGRRIYLNKKGQLVLSPGDYGLYKGQWLARPPTCHAGNVSNHKVTEHEDKTITVEPSILISDDGAGSGYHGYLRRGIWYEC